MPTNTAASQNEPVVQLTPKAIEKVVAARAGEGLGEHYGLRLAVVKGGCSGYEYSIKFADAPAADDLVYQAGVVDVYIDAESAQLLRGTVLDYVDGLHGAGLKFVNPNATHSCGCGSSFAAPQD